VKLSWRGMNVAFLCCASVQFTVEGHVNAFTPLLLTDLELSPEEVATWSGLLFGIMMATALPLAPFWGVLAERFSRRWIVLRAYYLLAVAMLVAAWAPDIRALVLVRVLMGLCFGTIAVVIAVQAMLTPRNRIGSAIATVQAAMPISASLGPPLGSLAIPVIGLRGLFLLDAAIALAAALALTVLMPEPAERVKKGSVLGRTGEVIAMVWANPMIRWNFASAFLTRGALAALDAYLPVRITQVAEDPATAIGWILGIYGVLTTAATWFVGRIIDRSDETKLYWRAAILATLATAGIALADSVWLLGILAAVRSVPTAFGNTLLFAHIARVVPPDQQTPVFSLGPVARNAGALILPLVAAAVAGLAPGAALGVAAFSYGGSFVTGFQLSRVTERMVGPRRREPADEEEG
jgi:DHA1 family multidrug resistance protein-like MFS transporter